MTARFPIPFVCLVVAVSLLGAGCFQHNKPKVAVLPPPPPPPVVVEAPEDTPIAFPQNVAVLPPVQPIPTGALPPLDPPPQVTERRNAAESESAPKKRANALSTAHKLPETPAGVLPVPAGGAPASVSSTPVPAAPPPVAAAPTPLVLSEVNAPAREALESRLSGVRAEASRIVPGQLNQKQRTTLRRVRSFIKLAEQALAQGELRQASELADRAETLSKALTDGN